MFNLQQNFYIFIIFNLCAHFPWKGERINNSFSFPTYNYQKNCDERAKTAADTGCDSCERIDSLSLKAMTSRIISKIEEIDKKIQIPTNRVTPVIMVDQFPDDIEYEFDFPTSKLTSNDQERFFRCK